MLTYLNKSKTAVIVLHEIYGVNKHIEDFCLILFKKNMDVFAPNMLQRDIIFNCNQENLAYRVCSKRLNLYGTINRKCTATCRIR